MPEQETIKKAREDKREGKSPSTQAGEFVREEVHHIREGKHGARSTKQAIAIGLSKARRAGVKLPPPKQASAEVRRKARQDIRAAQSGGRPSRTRARAIGSALRREGRRAATRKSLARQTKRAAARRESAARKRAAWRAVRTKGPTGRRAAARKAARTRAAR